MRTVNFDDIPEVDFNSIPDAAPKTVDFDSIPEVDFDSVPEEAPKPESVFGPVVEQRRPGASGSWDASTPGASGKWTPPPAVNRSAELGAATAAARTEGVTRPLPTPDAAAVNLLPETQRRTAVKTPGTYIPETQAPFYEPTAGEVVAQEAKGFARGLTAGAVGGPAEPAGGGTVGDIAGSMVTNLLPYLAGPGAGAAVNTYYAYLRDLNEQADQGRALPDMDQKRALARAAVALAFAKIPGAVGTDPLVKGATGALIGSAGNVADVAATQLAETGTIDINDPEYGPQYSQAALMGAAIGGPVGAISPSHGQGLKRPDVPEAIPEARAPRAPEAVPEVPFEAIPEEPEFSDAAVEAAYAAQYEPQAAKSPEGGPPPQIPEVPFEAIPETHEQGKAGDSRGQEEQGQQGREALLKEPALEPDYQRLAIRIARQHPQLSEAEAMAQAHILQLGDAEARSRGAGAAVDTRRIEFDQRGTLPPPDAPDVLHLGERVAKGLSDERGVLRVNPDDVARLGLQNGQNSNPTPMNAREMWRVMGRPVKIDPHATRLSALAEAMNNEMSVHDEGLVTYRPKASQKIIGGDLPDADHGYHADDLATALLNRPRSKGQIEDEIRAAQAEPNDAFPGQDERYLSGVDPKLKGAEEDPSGAHFDGKNMVDADGNVLFQRGKQRDLFGGEDKAPAVKPKAEQTDMFGNAGLKAGEGTLKGGEKGLEDTPLQRQADDAERGAGQTRLLQEGSDVTEEAKAHYGVTRFHKQGGYLTKDGKMLAFGNGGREVSDQRRTRGHEDVGRFFKGTPAAKARDLFMDAGNIRLFPEANGVELRTRPAPAQRKALEAWFTKARDTQNGAFHVDVHNGENKLSRSYPPETPASRILSDIDAHFSGEGARPLSEVQRMRASLSQEKGKVTKGEIEFLDDGSSTITIFTKHADFSTLMHEYGHWLRRKSLSEAENTQVEKWLKGEGIKVLDEKGRWSREAEERFARAFERYLRDRVAPKPELKSVFERIRQYMRLVYKNAKDGVLGKDIPPDVRKVFDQLLGFKHEEGPLRQEGEAPNHPKRAELQKKQEASAQAMSLEGETRPGKEPAKGRPQEPHPGLKGGVQEYTDPRLASPAGRTIGRGEAPSGATTREGAQQPLSPGLHGESAAGKASAKGESPTGQTTSMGAQQPLSPGLQGPGEGSKPPPPKTPVKRGDVGGLEARWDVPDETRFDYFLRRVQDKMRPLKLMQRAILKGGRRVLESTDAYLSEELYHGQAGAALRNADKAHVEPILESMKADGLDLSQVDEFLYARHAPERNAQIAKINPDPDRGSGMTDAEAQAVLDKAKADGSYAKLQAIAEKVEAMNKERLDVLESSGLISEETRKTWESAYKHYVPLKGFAEAADSPQDVMDYHLGSGFDIRGPESKRALGRKSLADSPLATSIAQMNEAIVRAHKNQVSKTFLKLVLDNPNKDVWEVNKSEFKQSLENGQVVQKQVINKLDPNVVTAKVRGKEYYITVKPKYTALAQAMKNMGEEKAGFIVKTLGKVNKVLALVNTTLSPPFALTNFLRDLQTAGINMAGENGTKFATKVMADLFPAMRGALQGIRESKFLTPSKSVEDWTRWYKRYEAAGGKTEYLGLRSVDDIKQEFESKLGKPSAWGKSKEGMQWLGRQIEDINGAVENAIRLSAFKNAVEKGLTEAKAASLAKNLTVNFNRKGELGTLANSLYLFFNANVQGTARIMAAMAKPNTPAGKKLWGIATGLAAASYGLAEYNRAVAGEDEDGINRYDKIAPFVKERNLVVMLPDSKGKGVQAVTIPIPYGYNVFNVVGESISAWMHGGGGTDGALNIGQALAGASNPLGSESSQSPAKWLTKMATPTVADPVVQYATNEAFTGAPIKPENLPYGTPKPQSQLAFKSVSPMARAAAEKLNELTGGSEYRSGKVDISPEALEHFVTSYTGSLGKFIYHTLGYVGNVAQGKDTDISKVPFARSFFQGENQYFDQKTFSDNANEYKPFLEEVKHLEGEDSKKFEAEFGPQIKLAQMAQSIQKQVESLNKQAKGIRGDKALSESGRQSELDTIDAEKKKLFREFNRAVQARKKNPPAVEALP